MSFDQNDVERLERLYPQFRNTGFLSELLALVSPSPRSVFVDDFEGKAIDTVNFWTGGGGVTIDVVGGSDAVPGGVAKIEGAASGSPVRLVGPDGQVNIARAPKSVFRIKTGPDITNVTFVVGVPNASYSHAAYWQYRSAEATGAWEAVTGSDATVVDSAPIAADTWYVLSIAEQPGYIDFGFALDPDGVITVPPVVHRIVTDLPTSASTDRRLEMTVVPGENAAKSILVDWVRFETDREV